MNCKFYLIIIMCLDTACTTDHTRLNFPAGACKFVILMFCKLLWVELVSFMPMLSLSHLHLLFCACHDKLNLISLHCFPFSAEGVKQIELFTLFFISYMLLLSVGFVTPPFAFTFFICIK